MKTSISFCLKSLGPKGEFVCVSSCYYAWDAALPGASLWCSAPFFLFLLFAPPPPFFTTTSTSLPFCLSVCLPVASRLQHGSIPRIIPPDDWPLGGKGMDDVLGNLHDRINSESAATKEIGVRRFTSMNVLLHFLRKRARSVRCDTCTRWSGALNDRYKDEAMLRPS